eukprot:9071288-Prorocentrum_lima.AAC.1
MWRLPWQAGQGQRRDTFLSRCCGGGNPAGYMYGLLWCSRTTAATPDAARAANSHVQILAG